MWLNQKRSSNFYKPEYEDYIKSANKILIVGMGGGVDILGVLLVNESIIKGRRKAILGSIHGVSFKKFEGLEQVNDSVAWVGEKTRIRIRRRFAEPHVAKITGQKLALFSQEYGVRGLSDDFNDFIKKENIDLTIFVDTGMDSLITGDENDLGTPRTDQTSLAVAVNLKCAKFLANIGFGVEPEISHYYILRNISQIVARGGFLGASGLSYAIAEKYLPILENIIEKVPSSTVSSICQALKGKFGLWKNPAPWTKGLVFLSPLMLIIFYFDIDVVYSLNSIAKSLQNTTSRTQINRILKSINSERKKNPRKPIPL
jgi:hypothetical protein